MIHQTTPAPLSALAQLHMLHIADSALPIGGAAHSFGLEALVEQGDLTVTTLETFFTTLLAETGLLEAAYCRAAHALGTQDAAATFAAEWIKLNAALAALKPARESRVASATLGRRLLQLVAQLAPAAPLVAAGQVATAAGVATHHCAVFGLIGSTLAIDADTTVLMYLHQSNAALISACQRLLPFGQSAAMQLLWQLKPAMIAVTEQSRMVSQDLDSLGSFTPVVEVGSARHPRLRTRLFIS